MDLSWGFLINYFVFILIHMISLLESVIFTFYIILTKALVPINLVNVLKFIIKIDLITILNYYFILNN